ncbi:MAG TPA: hypothetical protein VI197_05465 [Polyangiaceae bacterium]
MANSVGNQVQRPKPAPAPEKRDSEVPLSVSLPKERTTEPPPQRAQDRSDTIPAPAWFEEETD